MILRCTYMLKFWYCDFSNIDDVVYLMLMMLYCIMSYVDGVVHILAVAYVCVDVLMLLRCYEEAGEVGGESNGSPGRTAGIDFS